MSELDLSIVSAWRAAADALGIRVVTPYEFALKDGTRLTAEVFLPDFGSPTGAVAFSQSSWGDRAPIDEVWTSLLYDPYRVFSRELFTDTLNGWGWFGAGDPPDWYTGIARNA